jgi:hypothetical protein
MIGYIHAFHPLALIAAVTILPVWLMRKPPTAP